MLYFTHKYSGKANFFNVFYKVLDKFLKTILEYRHRFLVRYHVLVYYLYRF